MVFRFRLVFVGLFAIVLVSCIPTQRGESQIKEPKVRTATLYVSPSQSTHGDGTKTRPFVSLERAVAEASNKIKEGNVEIRLLSGVHFLESPIVLNGTNTSTKYTLTIASDALGKPAIISGGIPVSGWNRLTGHNKIHWAPLPKGANAYFLWTNPLKNPDPIKPKIDLHRATTPNFGFSSRGKHLPKIEEWIGGTYHQIKTPFSFIYGNDTSYAADYSLTARSPSTLLELVVPHGWAVSRLPILAYQVSEDSSFVYFSPTTTIGALEFDKEIGPFHATSAGVQSFYMSGSFPDFEGEYATDGSVMYVFTSEDPLEMEGAIIPNLSELITLSSASNVTFRGIQFSHTLDQSVTEGYVGVGSDMRYINSSNGTQFGFSKGALNIYNSKQISFEKTTFVDLGNLAINASNSNSVKVLGSRFYNLGGGGIRLQVCSDFAIEHSYFTKLGFVFGADAISVLGKTNGTISHNLMSFIAGRAVYITASRFEEFFSPVSRVRVEYNNIHDVTLRIGDAGAINTGAGGVIVRRNRIRNVLQSHWDTFAPHFNKAFYLDIGSKDVTVTENIIEDTDHFIQGNCQANNTVSNNYVSKDNQSPKVTFYSCEILGLENHPVMKGLLSESNRLCQNDHSCTTSSSFANNTSQIRHWHSDVLKNVGPSP